MKKLLLVLLILTNFTVMSQDNNVKEILNYKNIDYFEWKKEGFTKNVIVEVDSIKQEKLFNLTKDWIKEIYNTPSKVIKAEIEYKKIRVQGYKKKAIKEKFMGTRYFDASYSFEISIKDGKYKFEPLYFSWFIPTRSDWVLVSNGRYSKKLFNNKGVLRKTYKYIPSSVENLFNTLNISLYNYIQKNIRTDDKSDDW